jgi:hypothetical protein
MIIVQFITYRNIGKWAMVWAMFEVVASRLKRGVGEHTEYNDCYNL